MRIRSLALSNFGPFCGTHEVELEVGPASPVILMYGENMRGKTTFLNAIKWCLYGRVQDRQGGLVPAYRLMNYDALDRGIYNMAVTMSYEHAGQACVLERHVQSDHRPAGDRDLTTTLWMKRDDNFVDAEEIQDAVGNMLHEGIARFYLFDGEMLDQFELLISKPGNEAALVKDSIERVLGLPALQAMHRDLETLRLDTENRQQQAAKRAYRGEQLSARAQQVRSELDAVDLELHTLRLQLASVTREQDELSQQQQFWAERVALVRDLENLDQAVTEREKEKAELMAACQKILSRAWWMPIAEHAEHMLADALDRVQERTQRQTRAGILGHEVSSLRKALEDHECPVCRQTIPVWAQTAIQTRLIAAEAELPQTGAGTDPTPDAALSAAQLRFFAHSEPFEQFRDKETRLRELAVQIRAKQRKARDLRDQLRTPGVEDEIRTLVDRLGECSRQVTQISADIRANEKKSAELAANLNALNKQITQLTTADPTTSAEYTIYHALNRVFARAIEEFRQALRQQVEREATAIFRQLSEEPGYEALTINDKYGLEIIDVHGRNIRDRSAGAEQIVALSLVGALNRCAVREGPVVMDTPFGRLDMPHRRSVLQFVPTMSSQVILLVQSGEFDRDRDRALLGSKVGREYELVRDGGPTHSRISRIS